VTDHYRDARRAGEPRAPNIVVAQDERGGVTLTAKRTAHSSKPEVGLPTRGLWSAVEPRKRQRHDARSADEARDIGRPLSYGERYVQVGPGPGQPSHCRTREEHVAQVIRPDEEHARTERKVQIPQCLRAPASGRAQSDGAQPTPDGR
jgi:hypothetical protein